MNSKPIVISRVGSSLTVDVNVMGFATRDLLGRQGSRRTRFLAGVRECGQGASPQLLCVLCMGRRAQNTLELYQHACLFRRRLRVNPRTSVLSTLFYDRSVTAFALTGHVCQNVSMYRHEVAMRRSTIPRGHKKHTRRCSRPGLPRIRRRSRT